jgi:hypothetical protein
MVAFQSPYDQGMGMEAESAGTRRKSSQYGAVGLARQRIIRTLIPAQIPRGAVQAPGCAVLRPDYDAVFATEAEAQALLEWWTVKYPNVHWAIENCESTVYPSGKPPPLPVNAEWVNGQVRRLDIPPNWPTRTPAGGTGRP